MKIRDPLLLALLAGGQVELHSIPTPQRPPDPTATTIPAWRTAPDRADIDYERTLPPSNGNYKNPLDD